MSRCLDHTLSREIDSDFPLQELEHLEIIDVHYCSSVTFIQVQRLKNQIKSQTMKEIFFYGFFWASGKFVSLENLPIISVKGDANYLHILLGMKFLVRFLTNI